MKILYLADPNLIHDMRWITTFQANGNICYLLPRYHHYIQFTTSKNELSPGICLLAPIKDPSTLRPLRDLFQALRIRRIIRKNQIQLMHVIYAEPNALWGMWRFLIKVPMILTTLGTDVLVTIPAFFEKKDWLSKVISWQYHYALTRFSAITCTSRFQIQRLPASAMSVPVRLVRTGVDFSKIANAKPGLARKIGLDKPFVLMPRNMKPIYNHSFTLAAIALLNRELLNKFSFVFVNVNAPDQQYVQRVLSEAKCIQADIRFFPSFTHVEIISLYKEAELVVMNPISDGSPVSAMEAIACETPVILPPLKYDPDIFGTAFFFERWDPECLKSKIENVLNLDSQVLNERLSAGSDIIALQGNADRETKKIEMLYRLVLSDGVQE